MRPFRHTVSERVTWKGGPQESKNLELEPLLSSLQSPKWDLRLFVRQGFSRSLSAAAVIINAERGVESSFPPSLRFAFNSLFLSASSEGKAEKAKAHLPPPPPIFLPSFFLR